MKEKKYIITDQNGITIREYPSIDYLIFDEYFTYTDRQNFRESLQTNEPVKSGKFKGYRLQEI